MVHVSRLNQSRFIHAELVCRYANMNALARIDALTHTHTRAHAHAHTHAQIHIPTHERATAHD